MFRPKIARDVHNSKHRKLRKPKLRGRKLRGHGVFPQALLNKIHIFNRAVWMGKKVRATSKEVQDALAQSTHVAEEKISNIRTVKAFGKEKQEIFQYDSEMNRVLEKSMKEAMVQAKFYGMVKFV